MGSILNFLTTLLQFITGPFGPALIAVVVACLFFAAMFKAVTPMQGIIALFLGACGMSAAWFVSTFISRV